MKIKHRFPKYKQLGVKHATQSGINKVVKKLTTCVDYVKSPVRLCKTKCKIMDNLNEPK